MAEQPAIDPMHQFLIHKIVEIPPINLGGFMLDMSITNSIATLLAGVVLLMVFLALTARGEIVPNRAQAAAEALYGIIDNVLVTPIIGAGGRPYIPFIFTLFAFIFMVNMLGMVPYFFTPTAQLIVPVALALLVFATVLIVGFAKSGLGFLKLFFPSGLPWPLYFIVTPIELISFFSRPLSHSVRLWANIFAGHLVLKLFAGFSVQLVAPESGLGAIGLIGALLPLLLSVAMTALEFLVAFLQAYVFALLTCVYLNDALHADHH